MPTITYQVEVGPGSMQYYGTLVVSNIRYDDGGPVTIMDFLGITFKAPASFKAGDLITSTNPWQEIKASITNSQIDAATFQMTGKLEFTSPHTFNNADTFTFGVNGDLTKAPDTYTQSFTLASDALPKAE